MRTMTSVEAQNHFGMLLDSAQREPVSITRRGRPVAYLFSPQEYEALMQRKNAADSQTPTQLLAAFRGSGKGGSAARLVAERDAERDLEV
ncbi:MAG TPA: type II toxin-antitoxin system Phd/YefM family antitoxin [Desulfuromonadales bacterium]|nr:type II toxin-antitoxin system Phd/YefM family antitoxin [Desulfuromonadales bacterium]